MQLQFASPGLTDISEALSSSTLLGLGVSLSNTDTELQMCLTRLTAPLLFALPTALSAPGALDA